PTSDHAVLTRQSFCRRIVNRDPDHSLLLLKPTMTIGHGGGIRIKKNSVDYDVVAGWIRAGSPAPRASDPRIEKLDVFPDSTLLKPGESQQILVRARYSDGHSEDVTRWVKFGTSDGMVATVADDGKARAT